MYCASPTSHGWHATGVGISFQKFNSTLRQTITKLTALLPYTTPKMMFSRLIPILSLLLSSAHAVYFSQREFDDKKGQLCTYFNPEDSFFTYPLSQRLTSQIVISLSENFTYDKDFTLKVSIASGDDLKKVKLDLDVTRTFCFDDTSYSDYCSFIPSLKENPDPNAYVSLDDMVAKKGNQIPIIQGELSHDADGSKVLTYNIPKAGVYCTTFQFFGNLPLDPTIPESDLKHNLISIHEQQVHGLLASFEFDVLVLNYYSWLAQVVLIIGFSSYVFKKVSKDKSKAAVSPVNSVYQKSSIQFKILIFLVGSSAFYLLTFLYLRELNIYGYPTDTYEGHLLTSIVHSVETFFHFLLDSITIIFSTWAIYNFLLLSSGVFFGYYIDSKRMLVVNAVSAALLFEQLADKLILEVFWVYEYEDKFSWVIYVEELAVFCLGTFWVLDIYKQLENTVLKRKLATTYVLIFLVFFFYFAFANTEVEYILRDQLYERKVSDFSASVTSRVFSFIVCALVAFIWRDVKFVNNVIV